MSDLPTISVQEAIRLLEAPGAIDAIGVEHRGRLLRQVDDVLDDARSQNSLAVQAYEARARRGAMGLHELAATIVAHRLP